MFNLLNLNLPDPIISTLGFILPVVYYTPDRIVGTSYIIIRFVILRIDPAAGRVFTHLSYISVTIIVEILS